MHYGWNVYRELLFDKWDVSAGLNFFLRVECPRFDVMHDYTFPNVYFLIKEA